LDNIQTPPKPYFFPTHIPKVIEVSQDEEVTMKINELRIELKTQNNPRTNDNFDVRL
jgi:hypothetical protein